MNMQEPEAIKAATRRVSMAVVFWALIAAAFATPMILIESGTYEHWYARRLMPDVRYNGDSYSTPPVFEVRNGYIVMPESASEADRPRLATAAEIDIKE
jgi:hypothetical protein